MPLRDTQATIERFDFQGEGGGVLRLRGSVGFGSAQQARLQLVAEKFRALDRVDRRVAVSGSAAVGIQAGRLSVNGNFTVDEGLIDVTSLDAPTLDNDVLVIGRAEPARPPRAVSDGGKGSETGALARSDVDVRLDLGRALRLRGRGLDTRLGGKLHITSHAAGMLAVRGTVNTLDGTYTAYGQNLAIESGVISFTGDVANPRLDILAMRPDADIRVGVSVTGNPINPRVRLYSDPDLPELDKFTWLMTGRAPEGMGRDQAALLQRAAVALLAGERGNGDSFLKKFGIDELSVGNSPTGDTVVLIGKQLSKNLSVAYERGLSTTGGNVALLYRVAGWFTVRARTGSDNSVDVIWRWRWD
ncbi:MAG: translocation/assembly module TamB domain-containing protein [Rhodoferax sp.]|nr:translocation/assembly module TamB domain-containing protein [Rhodoferax sp.]